MNNPTPEPPNRPLGAIQNAQKRPLVAVVVKTETFHRDTPVTADITIHAATVDETRRALAAAYEQAARQLASLEDGAA